MALQKQNFPLVFNGGLDTKSDSKAVIPGQFQTLENAIFTKPGALIKRNGLDLLSNSINFTDAAINQGQALSTFQDQLLLFTGEQAYSRLDFNGKWSEKGAVSSVITNSFQLIRNGYSQTNPDGNKIEDIECYAWEDSRGGVRYSIIDSKTGNFVVSDALLSSNSVKPKVLTLNKTQFQSAQFVILFATDNAMCISRIYTNTLTIAPTLEYTGTGIGDGKVFDAVSCFFETYNNQVYNTTANFIALVYTGKIGDDEVSKPIVYRVLPDSIENFYLDTSNFSGGPAHISVCHVPDMSNQDTVEAGSIMYLIHNFNQLELHKLTFTPGSVPVVVDLPIPLQFEKDRISNLAVIWNHKSFNEQIGLKLFFEFNSPDFLDSNTPDPTTQYCRSADLEVGYTETTITPAQMTNVVLKKGIGFYSKPFINNKHPYIACIHSSEFQPTYFVVNDQLEVVSKLNERQGGGLRSSSQLCEVIQDSYTYGNPVYTTFYLSTTDLNLSEIRTPVGNGVFHFPTLKKGKIESENNTIFNLLGVIKSSLDFVSPNHFLKAEINDNLYTVGSVLQNYDGNKFTEAGFHLYPENVELNNSLFKVDILALGGAGVAQSSRLNMVAANRVAPGSYFTVSGANNEAQYYIWFKVDGVGTNPYIGGMVGIQINVGSYFTKTQMINQIKASLDTLPDFTTSLDPYNNLVITNIATGLSAGVLPGTISGGGEIAAGTYLYVCVWKYIDNKGRSHRSATSIPKSITLTEQGSVSVTVPLLSPTSKDDVILEVYRSFNQGSDFRRVTSLATPVFNVQNQDPDFTKITFIDNASDEEIQGNEILYTTGGVLDNDSPPPCSLITTFKNRLFIAGLDEKNLIQYTKLSTPDDKQFVAGFSDYLTIDMDSRGGKITALTPMDDKLIVFKETQIFFIAGDGPNNLGEGSFGEPQLISTDVGCNNPNSVVITPNGLMFKSPKGIYQLDRSLNVQYIGAPVEKYNDLIISSSILLNKQNQVRFLTEDGVALVYDYYVQKWTTFTNYTGTDCDIYKGQFVLLRNDGKTLLENPKSYKDQISKNEYQHIPLVAETADIAAAGLLGFQRIYRVLVLGEYKGQHKMRVSLAYDYDAASTSIVEFDAATVLGSNTYGSVSPYGAKLIYGGDFQSYIFRTHCSHQKCTAIRIRLEDIQSSALEFNEGLTISGISLEVGLKPGPFKTSVNKTLGSS